MLGGILVTSLVLGALGFERNGNRTVGGPYIALPHDTNFTVRFNFSGPYAPPLNISGCPPGEARYDSNWSCAFTAWSNATWPSGACNSVNLVYVRGATETSIDPGVPEQVCPGHPQEFTVILYADPSTSGPIVANVLLLVS